MIITLITSLTLILSACTSPKADGEKLAQKECEMMNSYVQNTITAYTNFVKEFGSKNYQSRVQAREELNARIDEVENQLASQSEELNAKLDALLCKYDKNKSESDQMYHAYLNSIGAYKMDTTQFAGLRAQANSKILTIIPPSPNSEKLQNDLIGRKIYALQNGYLSDSWSWTIERGDIKNLQIINAEDVDKNQKEFLVEMTLQQDGAAYKSISKIYYVLDNRDDWEIDMLEPSNVEVIKTGRYNSSITTAFYEQIFGDCIEFHNNSDAALLVGFRTLDSHGNYTKHSLIVGGGETARHANITIKDYSIDFIERP